jgi:fatty-acyl-CoA synthase
MEWFRKRTLGELPAEAARRFGSREALVFRGRRWTYDQLTAEVDAVAKGLIGLGVEPGDHVGVWLTNRPEWVFLQFAIPLAGAVTVPLNTRYRTDDVGYTVDQSDTTTLIAMDRSGPVDYAAMLTDVLPRLGKLRRVVMLGEQRLPGAAGWDELLAAGRSVSDEALAARAAGTDPDAPSLIIYTSGTTSSPKGAVHSHAWIRNIAERAELLGHTCNDVHLSYLPLFHAFGYSEVSAMAVLTGAKQVLTETFDADEVLDLAEAEGGTVLHGFDTHWTDLTRAQEARPRSLRLRLGTLAAGMDSSTPVAYRAQEVLCPTISGWGMSESWAFVSCSHPSHTAEQRCAASGYPMLDMEFRVIDPATGDDVPAGAPGELLFRGYSMMRGYYCKPEATAEAIDADGWLHTGDLASIRPDGHLVFHGRIKDMLKVGGENVAPAEIESRLLDLDGVAEVAVVGYPDPRLGEVGVAYVVPSPAGSGGSTGSLGEEQVLDHLRGRIASFKIPRHVRFVDSLPMTPSGKVRKVELRARALEELGDPHHG